MSTPWLSVIMPTYNGVPYIAQALDSVLVQNDADIELIVIDDGSTDGTLDVVRRYQAVLPLQIIERGRTGNWVSNSDHGLRQATGEYACFLHQDDFWYPGRLAELHEGVRNVPETVLWLHPVWYVDRHGKRLGRWTCPLPAGQLRLAPDAVLEHLLVQNFVGVSAALFRRDAFLATAGMDANLWYLADWDLWLSLAAQGTTAYLPSPLSAFRIHLESQTVQRGRNLEDVREQHLRVFDRHFSAWTPRDSRVRHDVRAAFAASSDLSLWLMGYVQGQPPSLRPVVTSVMRAGPAGWRRVWRDSRIGERVTARLKCRWNGEF